MGCGFALFLIMQDIDINPWTFEINFGNIICDKKYINTLDFLKLMC